MDVNMKRNLCAFITVWGIVLLAVLGQSSASAQTFEYKASDMSDKRTAGQLFTHTLPDTITTWCAEWTKMVSYPTTWGNMMKFKSLNSFVEFKVDNYYPLQQYGYTYQLTYQIYGYKDMSDTTIFDVISDTLTISNVVYNDPHNAYQDISLDKYSNYYKTMVVITGIYNYNAGSPVPADLSDTMTWNYYVENRITSQKYDKENSGNPYYGTGTSMVTTQYAYPAQNFLSVFFNFTWNDTTPVQLTPVSYELEWTYVDDYRRDIATGAVSTETDMTKLKYDFIHNSTRVWLNESKYDIPLVYPHGYIVYRMRMVRPDSLLYQYPIYSDWSYNMPDAGTIDDALNAVSSAPLSGDAVYAITNAYMHDSLNWQYTVSFAEGGKYKHVVSFYDGLLKNRESITRFNSTRDWLIATRNIYDFEGRPAIKTLPSPVPSSSFSFLHDLDLNAVTNLPYRANDFDSGVNICPGIPSVSPLADNALTNIYYSHFNSDITGVQRYVPDAEGYPFVHTIYSPGYPTRIDNQGGAGKRLQISDSNVITNHYVGMEQPALNRLFGIDAGLAGFYNKTVTSDPNKQLSVVVTDYEGKLVATSLAGRGADPADHAIDAVDAPDSAMYTVDILRGPVQTHSGNSRIAYNDFLNEAEGNVPIQYLYKAKPYPVCDSAQFLSVQVHYSYELTNACGDTLYAEDSIIGVTGVIDSLLDFSGTLASVHLDKATDYYIHKELSVNPADIDAALDSFFNGPNCYLTEPYFIRKAVEKCNFPCPSTYSDPCVRRREEMKQELHPLAKYGGYTMSNDSVVGDANSIFTRKKDSMLVMGEWVYFYSYRYQDTCTAYSLPNTLTVDGVTYNNIRTMPADSFKMIYERSIATDGSDPIAEALLPLHPEYCKLSDCFVDTFRDQFDAIPDFRVAEQRHLLYLDSIVAHDPVVSYLAGFGWTLPAIYDSLSTFQGGVIGIDSILFISAYCGCGDSVMQDQCISVQYYNEIHNKVLINDFVKKKYFETAGDIYLSNRERLIDEVASLSGDTCAHCAIARMNLTPFSVFGSGFGTGSPVPSVTDSAWSSMAHATWLLSILPSLVGTGAVTDSFIHAMADSAGVIYGATDSMLCFGQIDSIMARLSNCGNANLTVLAGIRNTLDSFCAAHIIAHGSYTPDIVRFAITRNGAEVNDFCNPYLIAFGMPLPPLIQGQNCKSDSFFSSAARFLREPAVIATLRNPGSVHGHTLDITSSEIELEIYNVLTDPLTEMRATWSAPDSLYVLYIYPDPSLGLPPADSVKIYLRGTGGCGNVFALGDSVGVLAVSCVNTLPYPPAMGLINQYSFVTDVAAYTTTGAPVMINLCSLLGWNNKVQTMSGSDNVIAECIPCTQMKALYKEFKDTMASLEIYGSDHPFYDRMLMHFMDQKLGKMFGWDQYETFIESCALSDSMPMPLYMGYANMQFANDADADSFVAILGRVDSNYTFEHAYRDSSSTTGKIIVSIDFNPLPYEKMWAYSDLIRNYPCPYLKKVVDTGLEHLYLNTGSCFGLVTFPGTTPVSVGFIHCPPGTDISSLLTIFSSFSSLNFNLESRGIWNGSSYDLNDYYSITYSPSGLPFEISRDIFLLEYLIPFIPSGGIVFHPFYESHINNDYLKIQKREYLAYNYAYDTLAPYQVLDSLQAHNLVARIPSLIGSEASYQRPFDPTIVTNLYISDNTMAGRCFDTLKYILQTVIDSNTINPAHICLGTNSVQVRHDSALYAYHCSDGTYWYRYFGGGDTLWNVYVAMPAWLPVYMHPHYSVMSVGPPDGVALALGDSATRFFTLNMTNDLGTDTIKAKGMTTFVIGKNIRLNDVLLGNPLTGATMQIEDTFDNCERDILSSAIRQGRLDYSHYIDSIKNSISGGFMAWMLDSAEEHLYRGVLDQEFNYTLYNYDRAGNLISTIPPAGVVKLDTGLIARVDTFREFNIEDSTVLPAHLKKSTYKHNSLNQLTEQNTPDGGIVKYTYDHANRLIFSQNAKQEPDGYYTYNLYDKQNRIIETGEAKLACPYFDPFEVDFPISLPPCYYVYPGSNPMLSTTLVSPYSPVIASFDTIPHDSVTAYIHRMDRRDVVVTVYDTQAVNMALVTGMDAQENLRKRVTVVKYFPDILAADSAQLNYVYATHYSYDIGGNVKTLVQDFPAMGNAFKERYKRIDYDYDLISGKVNMLSYNRSFADQYYQRYTYDDDNRIAKVQTSADGYIWKRDAEYTYYKHGPLARIDVGDLRVQGIDFAYTIQGWLKLVNSDTLSEFTDMGNDADITVNARDAAAFSIDYFKDDYKPISGWQPRHADPVVRNLFNGNIAGQTMDSRNIYYAFSEMNRLNKKYVYDQLNRILKADYATANVDTLVPTDYYKSRYTYDPDGNIKTLLRNGDNPAHLLMDSLNYTYGTAFGGYSYNQLLGLSDNAPDHYGLDIKYQHGGGIFPPNYQYDAIGNTTKDLVSGQDSIQWNLYNKVTLARNVNDSLELRFFYDGMGNRVAKIVSRILPTGGLSIQELDNYVHDAQGNTLATYKAKWAYNATHTLQSLNYYLHDHEIYGSSRLGVKNYWPAQHRLLLDIANSTYDTLAYRTRQPWYSLEYQDVIKDTMHLPYGNTHPYRWAAAHITGQKQYEVTDHLGNVLATVSDARESEARKLINDPYTIVAYNPVLQSQSDYYPFGMLMPGRHMEDTFTRTTNVSYTRVVPMHTLRHIIWPDGNATAFGGSSISTGTTPLKLGGPVSSGLTYPIYNNTGGIPHTVAINVTSVPASTFTAVVEQGTYSTSPLTLSTGGGNIITYNPPTNGTVTLRLTKTGGTVADTLRITNIDKDSISFAAISTVSTVTNSDDYQYGFNGQRKTDEWAGLGNHTTALFWEYDTRTGRRGNRDPVSKPWESPYATFSNSPIENADPLGDYDKPANTWQYFWNSITGRGYINRGYDKYNELKSYGANVWYDVNDRQVTLTQIVNEHIEGNTTGGYRVVDNGQIFVYEKDGGREYNYATGTSDYVEAHGGAFPHFTHIPPTMGVGPDVSLSGVSVLKGFKSFRAFKRSFGNAGEGMAWHHIVEQYASNISKFSAEAIHNPNNIIKLEHGAGSIHQKVSDYYSSKQRFTEGKTVREWLSSQSFEAQYEFGVKTLKDFGWKP